MTFGKALKAVKQGFKITRDGWNGKGMFVFYFAETTIHTGTSNNTVLRSITKPIKCRAHLILYTAQGDLQIGWLASQSDMLADDWRIVE